MKSIMGFKIIILKCLLVSFWSFFNGLFFEEWLNAQNILLNAGFEQQENPVNWMFKGPIDLMQPDYVFSAERRHSGATALLMSSNNPHVHGRAVQNVPVQGDQTYTFSAWFYPQGITSIDKSVMIRIKWFKGQQNLGYHYVYEIHSQHDGWYLAKNTLKALPGADRAEIGLELRWGTGQVWWDDIVMEPANPEPARLVKLATVYIRPSGPTIQKNVAEMEKLLDKAGQSGVQMICLPEGWTTYGTGLGMTKVDVNTLQGSASVMLARKARQYGMYIVSGLYLWTGDTLRNAAVLYNPQGQVQGIYDKIHLPDNEAEQGAVPGDQLPVFDTNYGRIGILICWDYAFPEVSRALALQGAEILFCPIAGDVRGEDIWRITARSRAVDNGVYFLTAIYDGKSVIINPAGEVLQETNTNGQVIMATVDLNFSPAWNWLGNEGRGYWKGVWRKDRRAEVFDQLTKYHSANPNIMTTHQNR